MQASDIKSVDTSIDTLVDDERMIHQKFNRNRDVQWTIMMNSPFETIIDLCKTNKLYNNICNQQAFWQEKFLQDYPEMYSDILSTDDDGDHGSKPIDPKTYDWKQAYFKLYRRIDKLASFKPLVENAIQQRDYSKLRRLLEQITNPATHTDRRFDDNYKQRHQIYVLRMFDHFHDKNIGEAIKSILLPAIESGKLLLTDREIEYYYNVYGNDSYFQLLLQLRGKYIDLQPNLDGLSDLVLKLANFNYWKTLALIFSSIPDKNNTLSSAIYYHFAATMTYDKYWDLIYRMAEAKEINGDSELFEENYQIALSDLTSALNRNQQLIFDFVLKNEGINWLLHFLDNNWYRFEFHGKTSLATMKLFNFIVDHLDNEQLNIWLQGNILYSNEELLEHLADLDLPRVHFAIGFIAEIYRQYHDNKFDLLTNLYIGMAMNNIHITLKTLQEIFDPHHDLLKEINVSLAKLIIKYLSIKYKIKSSSYTANELSEMHKYINIVLDHFLEKLDTPSFAKMLTDLFEFSVNNFMPPDIWHIYLEYSDLDVRQDLYIELLFNTVNDLRSYILEPEYTAERKEIIQIIDELIFYLSKKSYNQFIDRLDQLDEVPKIIIEYYIHENGQFPTPEYLYRQLEILDYDASGRGYYQH
jgi:hypothetical protein